MSNILAFKMDTDSGDYIYDPKKRSFINKITGEEVDQDIIKLLYEDLVDQVRDDMISISDSLIKETVSLAEWQIEMGRLIKNINLIGLSLSQGGWDKLNNSDYGYIGNQIKKQYKYLQNFANQIESGEQVLGDAFLYRSSMYADSSLIIFQDALRRSAKALGLQEERRILGGSKESCSDCINEANKGWSTIGSLRKIGDSRCKQMCNCSFEYK